MVLQLLDASKKSVRRLESINVPTDPQATSQIICQTVQQVRNSNIILVTGGVVGLDALFLLPFLYLIIGRKFDRLLKQCPDPYGFLDVFFQLPGIPILNQIFRTVIYGSLILHNYVPRLKKMEQRKQQRQRLGPWSAFWYKGCDYWYRMFQGYDFRANASRLEKRLVTLCIVVGGILLTCILLSGWNDDINQYYCGVSPPPP